MSAETAPVTEGGEKGAPPASRPSFSGDVLKLVTGTTFAQILVILASPLLTRLFSPEAFGLLAIFTSITKVLGVVSCLRYEFAIMLPDEERDAVNLLALCTAIVTGISLLALPFFIVFEPVIVSVLNAPGLTGYLWLVSPFVFVSGLFVALNYWNSRTRRYGRLSVARIVSSVAITGGQLAAGAAGMATGGALIWTSALGQGVGTAVLGAQILRDDRAAVRAPRLPRPPQGRPRAVQAVSALRLLVGPPQRLVLAAPVPAPAGLLLSHRGRVLRPRLPADRHPHGPHRERDPAGLLPARLERGAGRGPRRSHRVRLHGPAQDRALPDADHRPDRPGALHRRLRRRLGRGRALHAAPGGLGRGLVHLRPRSRPST